MGSIRTSSPNSPNSALVLKSGSSPKKAAAPTRLALGVVAVLLGGAFAGSASAKTSVQGGQNACKAAFEAQTPAPDSLRMDGNETKARNDTLVFVYRVKSAGDPKVATVTCTVDRQTNVATLAAEGAPPTTLATR